MNIIKIECKQIHEHKKQERKQHTGVVFSFLLLFYNIFFRKIAIIPRTRQQTLQNDECENT